jgi:hypothetical protein
MLREATEQTFETLAFLFTTDDEEAQLGEPVIEAAIGFGGPQEGRLRFVVAERMLTALAANMLGLEDDEITPELQKDALGEALNIVCGNLLPRMAGNEAVFHVLAPEVPAQEPEPGEPRAWARVDFTEGWVEVALFFTGVVESASPATEATP